MTDLIGEVFGKLEVIGDGPKVHAHKTVMCLCECGNERAVRPYMLHKGITTSCGCDRDTKAYWLEKRDRKCIECGVEFSTRDQIFCDACRKVKCKECGIILSANYREDGKNPCEPGNNGFCSRCEKKKGINPSSTFSPPFCESSL